MSRGRQSPSGYSNLGKHASHRTKGLDQSDKTFCVQPLSWIRTAGRKLRADLTTRDPRRQRSPRTNIHRRRIEAPNELASPYDHPKQYLEEFHGQPSHRPCRPESATHGAHRHLVGTRDGKLHRSPWRSPDALIVTLGADGLFGELGRARPSVAGSPPKSSLGPLRVPDRWSNEGLVAGLA